MAKQALTNPKLEVSAIRMLAVDWLARLAKESGIELSQRGSSGQAYTLGTPNTLQVTASFIDPPQYLQFSSSDASRQDEIEQLGSQALVRAGQGDLGGTLSWYSTTLGEQELSISGRSFMGPFLQRLGSQTRIVGWRRIGGNILLEFTEDTPDDWETKQQILAPKAQVHVHIATPSPCIGLFSSHLAHSVLETICAICTFALGRPIHLPPVVFPSDDGRIAELDGRRMDPAILSLARKHVGLDIFTPGGAPGGIEFFNRMRSAFLTFDAAVHQERDPIACILYVVAAEALTSPYAEWRQVRLTARFIDFFDAMIPDELDRIVAHGNFEEVMGIRRGARTARALRRELLSRIYDYRSGNLHEGLKPSYSGMGIGTGYRHDIRRGLFADFAEACILAYLMAPRGSRIGSPAFEQATDGEAPGDAA